LKAKVERSLTLDSGLVSLKRGVEVVEAVRDSSMKMCNNEGEESKGSKGDVSKEECEVEQQTIR